MLDPFKFVSRRLRAIAITPSMEPGGAEVWLSTLIRHSRSVRYPAVVVMGDHPVSLAAQCPGVVFYQSLEKETARELYTRAAAENGCDLIFFWGSRPFEHLDGINVPVVHVSHTNAAESANLGHREYCYELGKSPCNFMAAVCNDACSLFSESFVQMERPYVLYNGSDLERIAPVYGREQQRKAWGITPESKVILYMGRFYHGKGADIVIDALHHLDDDWHVVMHGWGEEKERMFRQAYGAFRPSSTGSDARVFWPQPRLNGIGDVYAAADVVVLPSKSEAFPLVMIEAWQASKPIVMSECNATKEVQDRYAEGRPLTIEVPRPPAARELAAAIQTYDQFPDRVVEANRVACSALTASAMVGRWESFFHECVAQWHDGSLSGMVKVSPTSEQANRYKLWTG